jgi:hypothetical protein
MEQASIDLQRELDAVCEDEATRIEIKGTHKFLSKKCRSVKIGFMRNETIRKISHVYSDKRNDVLHELQQPSKIAALMILNGFLKIKFFYPFLWRWFFYVRQYKAEQLYPITLEGKKKVPQIGYYLVTTLTVNMNDTVKMMTREEVRHTQSGLQSESKES